MCGGGAGFNNVELMWGGWSRAIGRHVGWLWPMVARKREPFTGGTGTTVCIDGYSIVFHSGWVRFFISNVMV